MTKKIDRTDTVHGAVKFLCVSAHNQRQWDIVWGCCGKRQTVTVERAAFIATHPPEKCSSCEIRRRKENHRDRKDRTGDQYGIAHVVGINPADTVRWLVRFDCCGTIKSLSAERCGHLKRNPIKRCDACNRNDKTEQSLLAAEMNANKPPSNYAAPEDIYGLWCRAMDSVRSARQ